MTDKLHVKPRKLERLAPGEVHEIALEVMGRQVITVLVQRMGGKVSIPMSEIDGTNQWLLGFSLDVPNRPTGDLKTDAMISGILTFEVKKRQ
jgi:hypothetical protein